MRLNNKDIVLKRFLPWVLLLGVLGLVYWILQPSSIIPGDNNTVIEAEAQNADEINADEINADEINADEINADEINADEINADEINADEINADEINGDEINGDEINGDEINGDEINGDEIPPATDEKDQSMTSLFVKHLTVFKGEKNYWNTIKQSQLNPVIVKQIEQIKGQITVSGIKEVDILYSDYVRNNQSIPQNSKVLAIIINKGKQEKAFYSYEDKYGLRLYDYDGKSPILTMDRKPFNYSRVTSPFDLKRKHPITGKIRPHDGVDLKGAYGTKIHSTGNGIVTFAGWQHGYGRIVIINHQNGYETRYAHLASITVKRGRSVKKGAVIGKLGNSGLSTGAHLHYEVRINGVPKNPLKVKLPSYRPLARSSMKSFQYYANRYRADIEALKNNEKSMNAHSE